MTKFIGKEKELDSLKGLLRKKSSSLVVIRGRRRIGKSIIIGKEMLKKGSFYQASSWATLLSMLIRAALEKIHFNEEITTGIKAFLENPLDMAACFKPFNLIQTRHREPAMVENIQSVISTLSKTTEIIVFTGKSHVAGIILGFKNSLAEKL